MSELSDTLQPDNGHPASGNQEPIPANPNAHNGNGKWAKKKWHRHSWRMVRGSQTKADGLNPEMNEGVAAWIRWVERCKCGLVMAQKLEYRQDGRVTVSRSCYNLQGERVNPMSPRVSLDKDQPIINANNQSV